MWIYTNFPPMWSLLKIYKLPISFLQRSWTTVLQDKSFRSLYLNPFLSQVIALLPKRNKEELYLSFFPPVRWPCTHPRTDKKKIQEIFPDYFRWLTTPTYRKMQKSSRALPNWTESTPGSQASTTFWVNLQFLWPHCILPKTKDKRKYTPENEDIGVTATSLKPQTMRGKKC